MPRIIRSPRSREDALSIWLYIARENEGAAERLLHQIDDKLQLPAANPRLGREREDIRSGLRYFLAGSYLILYQPVEGGIEVVRIVHGARNLEDLELE